MIGQKELIFDKRQTNIAKGIALLMLLWHHLFFNSPEYYDRFISLFYVDGIPVESFMADFCKICVSVFLFLSGYGLFRSYTTFLTKNKVNKLTFKSNAKYTFRHLIKLLSDYWFIYIVFVPIGLFFGHSFLHYYGINPIYYIADFFGVSYLFFGYLATINLTWWFMSIIIILYLIFPLLYRLHKFSAELLFVILLIILFCPFIPGFRELKLWICPFVFGMYVSDNNIIERISKRTYKSYKIILFSILSIFLLLYIRINYFDNSPHIDFLISLFIVLVSFMLFSRIPILNKVLEELGKYSGQIFMFHTFIFEYYFRDLIYCFKYSIVIFIVMVVICYLIARLLSWLMKKTRYNKLINKLASLF